MSILLYSKVSVLTGSIWPFWNCKYRRLEVQDPVFARDITMEISIQAMCIFNQHTKFCQSVAQHLALNFDATAYKSLDITAAM